MNHRLTEYTPEMEAFEAEAFNRDGAVFGETDEMELAAELLSVTGEYELDHFLGDLIKRAGQAVGKLASSPTGQALGGILKGAAKQALPVVGRALGSYLGGERGSEWGAKAADAASQYFKLELEGLSPEDKEFEAAKAFVRFASDAVKNAVGAPPSAPAELVAKAAVTQAAKRHAPGLLGPAPSSAQGDKVTRPVKSGRWLRQGKNILIVDV